MPNPNLYLILLLLILPIIISSNVGFVRLAEGGKRRIHITDDLDDVIDDEEDDAWKEWGKKKAPQERDLSPSELQKMEMSQIQQEMVKRHSGPAFGFVKLRLGVRRTPEMVGEMAMKWTKLLRTGGVEVKFTGIDLSTIMFNLEKGKDMIELKEFILNEPEAYEIKIGDQAFRRPGDPPLEAVVESLHREKHKANDDESTTEDDEQSKDEL